MSPKSYWIRITLDTISIRRSSKFYTCLEKSQCVSISRANRELSRFATEFATFLFILSWFALSCATFLFLRRDLVWNLHHFILFRRDFPWIVRHFISFVAIYPDLYCVSFSALWITLECAPFHTFSSWFPLQVPRFIFYIVISPENCDISCFFIVVFLSCTIFHFLCRDLVWEVRHFFSIVVVYPGKYDISFSSSCFAVSCTTFHFLPRSTLFQVFLRVLPCLSRHSIFFVVIWPGKYDTSFFSSWFTLSCTTFYFPPSGLPRHVRKCGVLFSPSMFVRWSTALHFIGRYLSFKIGNFSFFSGVSLAWSDISFSSRNGLEKREISFFFSMIYIRKCAMSFFVVVLSWTMWNLISLVVIYTARWVIGKLGNLVFSAVIWHGKCGISFSLPLFAMRNATFLSICPDFSSLDLKIRPPNFLVVIYVGVCDVLLRRDFLHISSCLLSWAPSWWPIFSCPWSRAILVCPNLQIFYCTSKATGKCKYWPTLT